MTTSNEAPGPAQNPSDHETQAVMNLGHEDQAVHRPLTDLPELPEFMPLVDSFREFMEAERERQRRRVTGLTVLFALILVLFLAGPVYLGRVFLHRAEMTFKAQEDSLRNLSASLDKGVGTLAAASDELRQAVELQQKLLAALSAQQAQGGLPAAASVATVAPAVGVMALTPAATNQPAAALPAPVTTNKPMEIVVKPGATNVAAVTPSVKVPEVPQPPATNMVMPSATSTNVADILRDVEARIKAIRTGNEALLKRLEGQQGAPKTGTP